MKSNYKTLGEYIQEVKVRNADMSAKDLLGINIDKYFMPSVANIVGTDLSAYKVVKKNQFACNRMHVGRDYRIPISLSRRDEPFMVSPAYDVFEIKDTQILDPEFLMMWFSRAEYDRNAWFYTDADVRGGLPWKAFCDMKFPLHSPNEQRALVTEYKTIQDRIKLNQQLIQKLEETAQAIYKEWFVTNIDPENLPQGWEMTTLSKIISVKDGTHDSPEPQEEGFPLATSTHLNLYDIKLNEAYCISEDEFTKANKRSKVDKYDILFSMIGTVGLVNYVLYEEINFAIKNVGLFKTSERKEIAEYVLFYLKSDYVKKHVLTNLSGSTQNYVTLGFLREMPILLPSQDVILKFEEKIKTIIEYIHLRVREVQKLEDLKNLLLAKMAST